jgi:hypothetical protein
MDKSERVQELERSAGVDDCGVVRIAARTYIRPVAERGAKTLSSVYDEAGQNFERCFKIRIDRNPSGAFGFEN